MAYLRAFGSWLPPRRVSDEELAPLVNVTPEWITKFPVSKSAATQSRKTRFPV